MFKITFMSFFSTLNICPHSKAGCGIHFYGAINPRSEQHLLSWHLKSAVGTQRSDFNCWWKWGLLKNINIHTN